MVKRKTFGNSAEKGITIVESMIALALITLALIIGGELLRADALVLERVKFQSKASALCLEKFQSLATGTTLPDSTGYISTDQNGRMFLAGGTAAVPTGYADYLIDRIAGQSPDLPVGCSQWPCSIAPSVAVPAGTEVEFVRVWQVTTASSTRSTRQVTIAIFPPAVLSPTAGDSTDAVSSHQRLVTFK